MFKKKGKAGQKRRFLMESQEITWPDLMGKKESLVSRNCGKKAFLLRGDVKESGVTSISRVD